MIEKLRSLKHVAQRSNTVPAPRPPQDPHALAAKVFWELRIYKELSDYDSRLQDLVDYYGYGVGCKAPYCRIYAGEDEGIHERLGITEMQYSVMHMHALFNRMCPGRHDMYYIFDRVVQRARETFGDEFCVIDFGCALGQIGMAFSALGIDAYLVDIQQSYLDFARQLSERRGISAHCDPVLLDRLEGYLDLAFPKPVGVVIESSSFEHIESPLAAYRWCYEVLASGGQFVTSTAVIEWDEETEEHFLQDAGPERFAQLRSEEYTKMKDKFREVLDPERSVFKIMVK